MGCDPSPPGIKSFGAGTGVRDLQPKSLPSASHLLPSQARLTCARAALICGGEGGTAFWTSPQPPGASGGVCSWVIPHSCAPYFQGKGSLSHQTGRAFTLQYPNLSEHPPSLPIGVGCSVTHPDLIVQGALLIFLLSSSTPISGPSSLCKTGIVSVGGRHGKGFGV